MNYGKLTAGTTKTAIDTAKPSEKGEIITYLSRMGDVLHNIAEWGKIILAQVAVHSVVNGDKAHVMHGKYRFRQLSYLQIIPTQSGHVLDQQDGHLIRFHKGQQLLKTAAVHGDAGNAVIREYADVFKFVLFGVIHQQRFLIGNAVALALQIIIAG